MRARRSRAMSAGMSPRWTASCRADSVCERRSVGARSLCLSGTLARALARWRTAPASRTNLVIGYLRWVVEKRHHSTVWVREQQLGRGCRCTRRKDEGTPDGRGDGRAARDPGGAPPTAGPDRPSGPRPPPPSIERDRPGRAWLLRPCGALWPLLA